jgi:hypothetical protein
VIRKKGNEREREKERTRRLTYEVRVRESWGRRRRYRREIAGRAIKECEENGDSERDEDDDTGVRARRAARPSSLAVDAHTPRGPDVRRLRSSSATLRVRAYNASCRFVNGTFVTYGGKLRFPFESEFPLSLPSETTGATGEISVTAMWPARSPQANCAKTTKAICIVVIKVLRD